MEDFVSVIRLFDVKIWFINVSYSSKQMTCPECRTKYTERSLKKLYLNIIPKSEDFQTDGLFEQLQEQRKLVSALKQDKERLMYNNKNIQEEAKKTREDFIKLSWVPSLSQSIRY